MVAMASRIETQRFDRLPSVIPPLRPAWDRSWQGVPPLMRSTGSMADQSMAVMSPWFGAPGQCAAMILDGAGSNSEYQASSAPGNTSSMASESPP